ncbi:diguanylate cyclase [Pseudomaricurvus alkylphenolicus]|uniref:GGDEF domain-containing protein n=1 Tax=Pseudomaricurvus alkylphenolicus TaxID=1306991 RepID=UPI001421F6C6|nr:diguanylate cyclase [Pseudomaricurvus alkylphenolicus]NIB40875.1 diguanylate cyclase [Pseudomaricurvus alkylphenolicus]
MQSLDLQNHDIPPSAYLAPTNKLLALHTARVAIAYPALWAVIALFAGYFNAFPAESLGVLLLFSAIAIIRVWQCRQLGDSTQELWLRWHVVLGMTNVTLWAALSSLVLLHEGESITAVAWLFANAGIISGGLAYMGIVPALAIVFLTVMLAPIGVMVWASDVEGINVLAVTTVIFWLQMCNMSIQKGRQHHKNLTDRFLLEQHVERFKTMSERDPLTGIANRGCFETELDREWNRARRTGKNLGLIFVDIDNFKQINDGFGHPVGDQCLMRLALRLEQTVRRPTDLVARYGGEEFVILLPDTDQSGAHHIAESIRESLESNPLLFDEFELSLTLSAGVGSTRPVVNNDKATFIKRIDDALYRAKQGGRNRVELAQENQPGKIAAVQ